MKKTRLMIIEDNRLWCEALKALINAQADMRVVGAFGAGEGNLQKIQELKPHVVLLDMGLRSPNGLRLVGALQKVSPNVRVVGMGLIPSQTDIIDFVHAGASGFILKDASVKVFLGTVRSVIGGAKVLPPAFTESLFSHVVDHALRKGKGDITQAVRMTRRELEIVALIAEGLSNKEIAQRLNIATYTVKSHVHNILEKLALRSRLQIAAYAHDEEA